MILQRVCINQEIKVWSLNILYTDKSFDDNWILVTDLSLNLLDAGQWAQTDWVRLGWADLLANCLIGSSFRTLAVSNISNNSLLCLCFVAASHQAAQTSHNELKCSSEVEFEASTPNYPRHGWHFTNIPTSYLLHHAVYDPPDLIGPKCSVCTML